MATTQKQTAEAPAEAPAPAPADPGPLAFDDVDPSQMFGRSGSGVSASRFTAALQDSYVPVADGQPGKVKQFKVGEDQRDKMIQGIRSEAGRLNIGVTVRHNTENGTSTIQFQAKVKAERS